MGITIEELRRYKHISGLTNEEISRRSGVSFGTVQKIFGGATKSPRYDTMSALEKVLVPPAGADTAADGQSSILQEGAVQYVYGTEAKGWRPDPAKQGHYTIKDRDALDESVRTELIDGVLYVMESPTIYHQAALQEVIAAFRETIRENGGNCRVFGAPLDMQLSEGDHRDVLQPDMMVLCDTGRLRRRGICGAPDLVLEILSPSTRKRDMTLKYVKYAEAGVREYWICDPDKKTIVVYDLEHDGLPAVYGRNEKIPVRIWDGRSEIDFPAIWDRVAELEKIIEG